MIDDTTSLSEKINNKLGQNNIFFITNDSERGYGIEGLIKNFHIVCIDHNQTVDYMQNEKKNIFCLEKLRSTKNLMFRNSSKLLNLPEVHDYISKTTGEKFIQVFKPNSYLEKIAESKKYTLLNTPADMNRRFEGKLTQLEFLSKVMPNDIPLSKKFMVGEIDYEKTVKEFGEHFVIQFNFGHTGLSTFFISSKEDLETLKKDYINSSVKVSKFIKGHVYTLVACATKSGTYIAGLSEQITGNKLLTNKEGATVGNDFCLTAGINPSMVNQIVIVTSNLGNALYKEGFRGLFGVDVVIDQDSNKIYIIEINARQPASTSFLNKILLRNYQIPISLIHIAEFLGIDINIPPQDYSLTNINTIKAAQIIVRNYTGKDIKILENVKNGIYRLQSDNSSYTWTQSGPKHKSDVIYLDEDRDKTLVFQKESYSVETMDTFGLLFTSVSEGRVVTDGTEVFRIQALQDITNEKGELHAWCLEIVQTLKNIYRLHSV